MYRDVHYWIIAYHCHYCIIAYIVIIGLLHIIVIRHAMQQNICATKHTVVAIEQWHHQLLHSNVIHRETARACVRARV